jgi:hypothetical protein
LKKKYCHFEQKDKKKYAKGNDNKDAIDINRHYSNTFKICTNTNTVIGSLAGFEILKNILGK